MAEFDSYSDIWMSAFNAALSSGTLAAIADDCADRAVKEHRKRFEPIPGRPGWKIKEGTNLYRALHEEKDDSAG